MMMRRRAGFTLIELIVAIAIVMVLVAVAYASYVGFEAKSRDNAAIGLADQLAANLAHYAALNGGAYPTSLDNCWYGTVSRMGSMAEFTTTPPAIFLTGSTDTSGCNEITWSDSAGSTFQIEFRAAGAPVRSIVAIPTGWRRSRHGPGTRPRR